MSLTFHFQSDDKQLCPSKAIFHSDAFEEPFVSAQFFKEQLFLCMKNILITQITFCGSSKKKNPASGC